ncbi:hypothetical protein [Sorangium sp. So ce1335]|uniref:hypothetical protein n=1 Tax=Sorangium sp. So ce1335 TaxID=3133335 RepID=UPI003F5E5DE9
MSAAQRRRFSPLVEALRREPPSVLEALRREPPRVAEMLRREPAGRPSFSRAERRERPALPTSPRSVLADEDLDARIDARAKRPSPPVTDAELDERMGIPSRATRALSRTPVRVQAMTPTFARLLAGGSED